MPSAPELLEASLEKLHFQSISEVSPTFLKAVAGAISAPFRVLNRNIGQEEAFIRNPTQVTTLKKQANKEPSKNIVLGSIIDIYQKTIFIYFLK